MRYRFASRGPTHVRLCTQGHRPCGAVAGMSTPSSSPTWTARSHCARDNDSRGCRRTGADASATRPLGFDPNPARTVVSGALVCTTSRRTRTCAACANAEYHLTIREDIVNMGE
jgi:hypothetical protein